MCCSGAANRASGCSEGCCPCCCGTFRRRFLTAKEEREHLGEYREQLKQELAALEERMAALAGE